MFFEIPADAAAGARLARAGADEDLVERAKSDRTAFAALYRFHVGAIAGYIFRRTGDPSSTEDITAEVFLRAMRSLGSYRRRGVPYRYYLLRIATNLVHNHLRDQKGVLSLDVLESDEVEDSSRSEEIERRERSVDALRALQELPAKWQAVLALFYLEGLSIEDVAKVLRCREGTIKSRLARGRDALRAKLERKWSS